MLSTVCLKHVGFFAFETAQAMNKVGLAPGLVDAGRGRCHRQQHPFNTGNAMHLLKMREEMLT